MIDQHIPEEDLALYAMQALPDAEAAALRVHLLACALCRDNLAVLSGDLAMIGAGVEQHPLPEGARQRFLDRIAAVAVEKPAVPVAMQSAHTRRRNNRWPLQVAWTAAALFAIVAILLGLKVNSLHRELRDDARLMAVLRAQSDQAQRVLDLLNSQSAQHVMLTASKTTPQPTGRTVYLANSGTLIFQANNLKHLSEGRTYELWLIPANATAPIPAGLFRPDVAGNASVILPPIPKGVPAKGFGVTIEKAEGSTTPSAPIILSGAPSGE